MGITSAATVMQPNAPGELPVCFQQEARLISEECARMRTGREPSAQNLSMRLRLQGPLDLRALEGAVQVLVDRHSALRARCDFSASVSPAARRGMIDEAIQTRRFVPGTFVQSLLPSAAVPIRRVSVARSDAAARREDIRHLTLEQATAWIDPRQPPLVRALLATDERDEHLLVLTMPHLISDAWSMDILHRELVSLYHALATSGAPPAMPPAAQYHEYAIRQHDRFRTGDFEASASHWRERWSALRSALIDRHDWPEMVVAEEGPSTNATERLELSHEMTAALRAYARRARVPLYSVYLAALGITLRACTAKSTVALWINAANRMAPDTDSMVGWLANSTIIGLEGGVGASGRDVLEASHAALTDAVVHGDLPLALFCNVLGQEIHFGDVPVSFDRFVIGRPSAQAGGVTVVNEQWHGKARHGAVELAVVERPESVALLAMYDAGRWSAASLRQFARSWHRVLTALVECDTSPAEEYLAAASTS